MSQPNPLEVERFVKCLMTGLQAEERAFEGPDMMSGVLTFAKRFVSSVLTLSLSKEARMQNARIVAGALRNMASIIEFEELEISNEKVH